MQVQLLGPLVVRASDGTPVEVAGSRLRALLSRLALEAGRPVSPAALADAVWGGEPPAAVANALQTLVSRLRRQLAGTATIGQSAAGYCLELEPDDVDAHRFSELAAAGRRALAAGDPATAARVLGEALALWQGRALADTADSTGPAGALQAAAERLVEARVSAVLDRAAAELALGRAAAVLAELEQLALERPLDERVAARLVDALARDGRPAEALRAYEQVRARLAEELGVDPSGELRAVHLAVLRGEVDAEPSPRRAGGRRTNLTAQLTSFVGREDELDQLGAALADHRLVTVVGPGGAGKTRLAAEAGARLAVADGVWLAELAPLTDPGELAQAVLGGLGFRDTQLVERRQLRAHDATARLLDALADRDAVVVLDNCEHLIEAAARLAELLLRQCPGLRVLATSREPLGITGEVVLALPPLRQPEPPVAVADALAYPAVRLFTDRAAAARPGFAVDDTTVDVVVDIVGRLDGLPLAIELAAARLRTLPLAEIATRLSDRFRLLTGGSRTALPRHRTLRAVVEWSWDLLAEPERRLAERLAVFPAGVVAESAAAVCGGADLPAADVADLLASLIDKSLLQRIADGERLRMLETIREYGIERLAERGELATIRGRHADYFARLVVEAEPHLVQRDQLPWLARLGAERDNILAALRFRCSDGDADGALEIAVGFGLYAMIMGQHVDIAGWMGDALAVPGGTDDETRMAGQVLYALHATVSGMQADEVDAGVQQLAELAAEIDQWQPAHRPMFGLLRIAGTFLTEDEERTEKLLAEELASPHAWARAGARMMRANLAENRGQVDAMREDIELALAEFRELGERWGLANTLRSAGLLHTLDGDLDAAEAAYAEAFELMSEMQSRDDEVFFLMRLADLAVRRGQDDRARELMDRAHRSAEENAGSLESVFTVSLVADFERRYGNVERARALHADATRRVEGLPAAHPANAHGRAVVYALAARFAGDDGDPAAARRFAAAAFAAAQATRDMPLVALVGGTLAEIALHAGASAVAAEMLGAAARLRGSDDATSTDVIRMREQLTTALGPVEFAARYEHGKGLDQAAAIRRLDPAEALPRAPGGDG